MPNHDLTKRPSVAKIKHATGTTFYSDPTTKSDPDARGIRLAVGTTTKTWVLSRRIDGKVRSITLGSWPELPTVFAARDVAKEKVDAIDKRTDAQSSGIRTLRDAMESHIWQSSGSTSTHDYYRAQIDRHLPPFFVAEPPDVAELLQRPEKRRRPPVWVAFIVLNYREFLAPAVGIEPTTN